MHSRATTHNGSMSSPDYSNSPNSSQQAAPVAFAEFKDADCGSFAMNSLQGTYLLSSDRGPIRIEFAKSKMAIIGGGGDSQFAFREVKELTCHSL